MRLVGVEKWMWTWMWRRGMGVSVIVVDAEKPGPNREGPTTRRVDGMQPP